MWNVHNYLIKYSVHYSIEFYGLAIRVRAVLTLRAVMHQNLGQYQIWVFNLKYFSVFFYNRTHWKKEQLHETNTRVVQEVQDLALQRKNKILKIHLYFMLLWCTILGSCALSFDIQRHSSGLVVVRYSQPRINRGKAIFRQFT